MWSSATASQQIRFFSLHPTVISLLFPTSSLPLIIATLAHHLHSFASSSRYNPLQCLSLLSPLPLTPTSPISKPLTLAPFLLKPPSPTRQPLFPTPTIVISISTSLYATTPFNAHQSLPVGSTSTYSPN